MRYPARARNSHNEIVRPDRGRRVIPDPMRVQSGMSEPHRERPHRQTLSAHADEDDGLRGKQPIYQLLNLALVDALHDRVELGGNRRGERGQRTSHGYFGIPVVTSRFSVSVDAGGGAGREPNFSRAMVKLITMTNRSMPPQTMFLANGVNASMVKALCRNCSRTS